MYSRFSAVVRFSEPPLGTQFRALVGQPCAPTLQSWLRIPGVDRQPGRLRPRRRLHRQVAQEFIAGESLYALSKRHDISRQLIRVWVEKYQAGALEEDAPAADILQEYEAKIAALERMVGRQALEIEFLKGALKNAARPRSVNTSVIAGPAASQSQKDAG